jgi:predicted permease
VLAIGTTMLFGFAPAWRASDPALAGTLRTNARSMRSGARLNLQKILVVAQVALSLLLVAASALFLRSLNNLASLPLGFEPDHLVSASINPRATGYAPKDLDTLYRRVVDRVEALPGVEVAAVSTCGLMTGCRSSAHGLTFAGYTPQPGEDITVQENRVSRSYVQAAGLSLLEGRDFTVRDHGARVAIVNEALARRYFGSRNPIGQLMGRDKLDTEIIGVVKDARINSVREAAAPAVLFPLEAPPGYMSALLVKTNGDPGAIVAGLRRAITEVEPSLPVDRVMTVGALAAGTFRQERLVARLTTMLGLIALALACLGVYGVMSYAVKQRTPELAIRFALGAPRSLVLWMVFRESLLLMIAGIAIGVPIVLASSRLLGTLLFDVSVADPVIVGGAVAILLLVGTTSSYIPSWRASRVDPVTALRTE